MKMNSQLINNYAKQLYAERVAAQADNLQPVFKTLIKANRYFDPATSPYEVFGFYEDFTDLDTFESLGGRMLEATEAPRTTGSPGMQEQLLTESVTLVKGFKTVTVKASPRKPRRVRTMILILCGKLKAKE